MRKIRRIEPVLPAIPNRKKVAAYARVSRDTERLAHSLSAQVSYYSTLIQGDPEWEYAGVYADFAVSGTGTEHRDEFLRLVSDCESGKIDIVLTKSISRFARNTVDLLETVRHLKSLGIEVRFEKEHINSMSGDGELMLSILACFAQEESRSISENCKWGIRKRFQSGEIGPVNKHILGYRYDEEQKKYVIIPEEAETVRWIFEMYLEGFSLRQMARSLNEAGLRTITGCEFAEASLDALVHNEIYAGDTRRQKSYIADPLTKSKARNRGELPQYYMEDCHEAILDRDAYTKVQVEMERRAAMQNPTYCFTGKIRCGICGMVYSRNKRDRKGTAYAEWLCRSKKEAGRTCKSRNYSEKELQEICAEIMETDGFDEAAFVETVKEIIALPDGNLEIHFYGGKKRMWQMPPKPPKPAKLKAPKPERKRQKHIFDGKIFCGQCGRRFGRAVSQTAGGGHLYWYCRAKSSHGVTCDSVNYFDAEVKDIFCKVMGQETFDEEYFTETVERMAVQKSGSIDFHLKDGTVRTNKALKLRSNGHKATSTDEFAGKIRCASCGNLYHRYSCYGKYVYWRCSGKFRVRTECGGQDFADFNIRKVTAYMMGMDEFDGAEFEKRIEEIKALEDGSLEYHFREGKTAVWQKA